MSTKTKKIPKPVKAPRKPLDYFDTFLRVGSEAADLVAEISHNLTPLGAASVGIRVIERYRNYAQKGIHRWLEENNKKYCNLWDYDTYAYRVCAFKNQPRVVTDVKDDLFVETEIDGITYYWILDDDNPSIVEGPYVDEKVEVSQIRSRIGQYMWEDIGSSKAILIRDDSDSFSVEAEGESEILPSKTSDEILSRVKKFADKGINRSVVLLGEPGTGKSTMMRYIAENIGGFSLRIAAADLKRISSHKILGAIRLLVPKCLLIDDFDRIQGHDSLLSELEELNKTVKLFIVSVNDVDNIPQAVLRPGRFDELHTIRGIDKEVVERLIGENVADDIKRALMTMPIAYVVEFKKRREVLGAEGAVEEARELLSRSHRIFQLGQVVKRNQNRRRRLRNYNTPLQKLRRAEQKVARAEKSIIQTEKHNEKATELSKRYLETSKKNLEREKVRYEKHKQREEEKKKKKKEAQSKKKASKKKSVKKVTSKKVAKKKASA